MKSLKSRRVSLTNVEKLKIIQKDLEEGYVYSEIITSTIDKYGYPIGQWINGWRTGSVGITEEDRKVLQSMGETFEPKYISVRNPEKLKIIRAHIEKGNSYLAITKSLKDEKGNPIGRWIFCWRNGSVKLSSKERQILISWGETFEKKRKKLKVYPTGIEIQSPSLTKQDITTSEKVKKL